MARTKRLSNSNIIRPLCGLIYGEYLTLVLDGTKNGARRTSFLCFHIKPPDAQALLVVVNHAEPLGEQPALALLLRAVLDLDPVANEFAVLVSGEVRVVLHAGEALA